MEKDPPLSRLRAFASDRGLNSRKLAELIGCSQGWAWRILAGEVPPNLNHATAIQLITGGQILATEWARPEIEAHQ